MKRCITCKHWGTEELFGETIAKSCRAPKMLLGYQYDDADIPLDGANVEDDEGWGILTGPQFGCVLHEVKPFNTESMLSILNDESLTAGATPSSEQVDEFFGKE